MKKYILVFISYLIFSCSNENLISKIPSNGFINGLDAKVMMGSESAVETFNKIDKAWADLDYDLLKTFIADSIDMKSLVDRDWRKEKEISWEELDVD